MGFMQWTSAYEIGIPELDEQHKRWLELLNRFYDHVNDGHLETTLLTLVDEALAYTNFHFASEEAYMAQIGYPRLPDQKRLHNDIRSQLEGFQSDLREKKFVITTTVTRQLKSWFTDHILKEDKAIADFVHSRP